MGLLNNGGDSARLGDSPQGVPGFVFWWEILHIQDSCAVLTVTFPHGSISCEAH